MQVALIIPVDAESPHEAVQEAVEMLVQYGLRSWQYGVFDDDGKKIMNLRGDGSPVIDNDPDSATDDEQDDSADE